jgi:hypothetical protein
MDDRFFKEQEIAIQLRDLYLSAPKEWDIDKQGISGFDGTYEKIYDNLTHNEHQIEFNKEQKERMWKLSYAKIVKENPEFVENAKHDEELKELLKEQRTNLFKSYLVRAYLLEKKHKENLVLDFLDQRNNPIKISKASSGK